MREQALKNLRILGKSNDWTNTSDNIWNYRKFDNDPTTTEIERKRKAYLPFIDYVMEDKSKYPFAKDCINPKTGNNWFDPDDDFRVGKSGGLLMNIDFIFVNTHKFTEVADYFIKNKKYCPYEEDTDKYFQFWDRETKRRRKGVQARCKVYFRDIEEYFNPKTSAVKREQLRHYVRITGDHYNYLNYGRIERTPNPEERADLDSKGLISVNTVAGFPRFWDADYWYYKTDEFIIRNKRNNTVAKARRKGISYKRGSQVANTVNLNKAVTVVMAADIIDYLTDPEATADMAKKNLTWYEDMTYWRRGFLSESIDNIELGYKKSKEGNKKYGFRSKVISVAIGRNESAAIGKKAIAIDFEESGRSPNLQNAWNVTLNNIESGAIKIGTGRIYGTAGTKNTNWTAFRNIYYNPDSNNMMPFEDVWDYDARHVKCCFFIPQVWCCEPFIYDGNSLFFDAWKWDKEDKIEQKKHSTPSNYTTYCAQRANMPSEAFIDTKDNMFSSPELNEYIRDLYDNPEYKYYTDGWYVEVGSNVEFWNKEKCMKNDLFKNGGHFHNYIEDVPFSENTDIHGCVREIYPPYIDPNTGKVKEGAYFITVDAYRVDKDRDQVNIKNSLYGIQCWLRANQGTPYEGKILVASYTGRLDTMAQNDRIALNMAIRYNCGVLPEAGTGELVSNFKVWQYSNKLMYDPSEYIDRSLGVKGKQQIGIVIGDGEKKIEGLRMLRDYLYEIVAKTEKGDKIYRLHRTNDLALCLELQRFNLEGNFDRVSTAIIAMFEFKKDFVLLKEQAQSSSTTHIPLSKRLKRKSIRDGSNNA